MKIESIKIENFRSYKDQTIFLDDYTCFVGPNGAGKSTVFNALNIFFRQFKDSKTDLSKLCESDFHHKNTSDDIKITVTFFNLSPQAQIDLADYVRHGKLIITAVAKYDSGTQRAEVKQYGSRMVMPAFKDFFENSKASESVTVLRPIYLSYREQYNELPSASTKAAMSENLQKFESQHPDLCELVQSEDQFYGASRGINKLAPHVQWVFVSASKDASEEGDESKNSALGSLLSRTVRSAVNFDERVSALVKDTRQQYQEILEAEQGALDGISKSLQTRLSAWSHPDIKAKVQWKNDVERSIRIEEPLACIRIGERGFEGDLNRFGHGLQRSYMLALLQELAMLDDDKAPTLIMGIEEPELYQHPPQARYLAETLLDLSESGSQILICTHNPLFIPGDNFDKIRIVRETSHPSYTSVTSATYKDLTDKLEALGDKHTKESGMVAKLYPSLNPVINEMFFCKILILVEGYEDVAYITSYLILTGLINEFRKAGCHIVPVEGKSKLLKPLTLAKMLTIPAFVVFDGDTNKEQDAKPERREEEIRQHRKENKALLQVQGHGGEDEWPKENLYRENVCCWSSNMTDMIKNELGAGWHEARNASNVFYGNASGLEKNPLAIAKTLEFAWGNGVKSGMLLELIHHIVAFAQSQSNN